MSCCFQDATARKTWRWYHTQCLSLTHIPLLFTSLMFWTNWNEQSPSIMRAQLSGANVLVIISSDIRTPNGLAIDHRAEKIYFSDATLDKIERCEYDGSRRYVSQNLHPWVSILLNLHHDSKSNPNASRPAAIMMCSKTFHCILIA